MKKELKDLCKGDVILLDNYGTIRLTVRVNCGDYIIFRKAEYLEHVYSHEEFQKKDWYFVRESRKKEFVKFIKKLKNYF